jgi:hypothetical protein
LHATFKENGIVMWFLTLSHWTLRESCRNLSRRPKGTEFQTDHATYKNLARRQKSKNDAIVMHAYEEPATWSKALEFCKNRGMKEGTFKNIDYKLKDLAVIVESKRILVSRGSQVKSALSRRREILIGQIEAATNADDNSRSPGEYVHDIQGRGTLADKLFWSVAKRIKENDEVFRGLPIDLEPIKYFREGGYVVIEYQDKVSWLWKVQDWLAGIHPDS